MSRRSSWRSKLSASSEATFKSVEQLISRQRCTKALGKGSNGKVLRVCQDKECKRCSALKLPTLSRNGHLGGVHTREGDLLEYVTEKSYKEPRIFAHVSHHVRTYSLGTDVAAVEMSLIRSTKIGTLQNLLEVKQHSVVTKALLQALLVQTFATLDWLNRHADGFIHLDLKPDQIAFKDWPSTKTSDELPTSSSRYKWVVPRQESGIFGALWPVLIDFGLSFTRKHPDIISFYDVYKNSNMLVLDCYRMLAIIWERSRSMSFTPEARQFIKSLVEYLFGHERFYELYYRKDLSDFSEKTKSYGYLTKKGLEKASKNIKSYSDVIENRFFSTYLTRV